MAAEKEETVPAKSTAAEKVSFTVPACIREWKRPWVEMGWFMRQREEMQAAEEERSNKIRIQVMERRDADAEVLRLLAPRRDAKLLVLVRRAMALMNDVNTGGSGGGGGGAA